LAPSQSIIVLADSQDMRVSASVQTAYVEALRRVISAPGTKRTWLDAHGVTALVALFDELA
jgi:hypothetical protein